MQRQQALIRDLRAENEKLRRAIEVCWYMARRYADGRLTWAPRDYNDHTRVLLALGVDLQPGGDGTVWATNPLGRSHDGLTDDEAAMGA